MNDLESNLWKHFHEIVKLSHGSGKEDPVRQYIASFAAGLSDVKVNYYQCGF